jgi:hypothetical protein
LYHCIETQPRLGGLWTAADFAEKGFVYCFRFVLHSCIVTFINTECAVGEALVSRCTVCTARLGHKIGCAKVKVLTALCARGSPFSGGGRARPILCVSLRGRLCGL